MAAIERNRRLSASAAVHLVWDNADRFAFGHPEANSEVRPTGSASRGVSTPAACAIVSIPTWRWVERPMIRIGNALAVTTAGSRSHAMLKAPLRAIAGLPETRQRNDAHALPQSGFLPPKWTWHSRRSLRHHVATTFIAQGDHFHGLREPLSRPKFHPLHRPANGRRCVRMRTGKWIRPLLQSQPASGFTSHSA